MNIKADVSKQENPFKNKTVVLDPGHGGSDQEPQVPRLLNLSKNYTLKTALELKRIRKAGAHVKLTRTDDSYVSLDNRKATGDVFISIHNDSLDSHNANGATVYWYQNSQETLAEVLNANIQKVITF